MASIVAGKSCVSWGSCPESEFAINPKPYPEPNTSCKNSEIHHMPMNDLPIWQFLIGSHLPSQGDHPVLQVDGLDSFLLKDFQLVAICKTCSSFEREVLSKLPLTSLLNWSCYLNPMAWATLREESFWYVLVQLHWCSRILCYRGIYLHQEMHYVNTVYQLWYLISIFFNLLTNLSCNIDGAIISKNIKLLVFMFIVLELYVGIRPLSRFQV